MNCLRFHFIEQT